MQLKRLIKIVSLIDKEAAKYIKENVLLGNYPDIDSLFSWYDTPQGYDYWDKIDDKFYEIQKILKDEK